MSLYASAHSPPATSRHKRLVAYRCFLPDLTRFTRPPCARPGCCEPSRKGSNIHKLITLPWNFSENEKSPLKKGKKMAESERFELSIQRSPYTRFPGVLLQPLGQLSMLDSQDIFYCRHNIGYYILCLYICQRKFSHKSKNLIKIKSMGAEPEKKHCSRDFLQPCPQEKRGCRI